MKVANQLSTTALVLVHPNYVTSNVGALTLMLMGYFDSFLHARKYRKTLEKTIAGSGFPVYVLHDKSLKQKDMEKLRRMAKGDLKFIETEKRDPLPKCGWDAFCQELKSRGVGKVLLGGSLYYTRSVGLPGERNESDGCVEGTRKELRKAFDVELLPALCWPEKGYDNPQQRNLRFRGNKLVLRRQTR